MTASTYPHWIYDDSEIPDPLGCGERAVTFLRNLNHPKSRTPGGKYQLDHWQERLVRRIYGPRHDDGSRVVKTVTLLLPRGNRKTSLSAALGLLHTIGPEREPGGEVVSAASDRKQARIAFREAVGLVRAHPKIKRNVTLKDYQNCFESTLSGAWFESISNDAGTQHGRTPSFVLADELHVWKKHDLWEALKSGLAKTPGTLLVVATTAGRGQENIAFEIIDYARKVARGDIDDSSFLAVLFEAQKDDDWRDEELWRRVNPGLTCSPPYPDIEGLRQLAKEAEHRPSDRESFRQLNLNVWLDHSADPFVEMAIYDEGARLSDDLEDREAWIAVDMSSTTDLTAVVACVKVNDEFHLVPHFFCPGDALRKRAERDGVPYVQWEEDGFLTATPGNVIDYEAVVHCIRELCARFHVNEIGFDPAYAQAVMAPLQADGLPVMTIRQGWVTQSPALNELERVILDRRLCHGGHPVLRWCFDNVAIHTDSAGNRTMHKGKSTDRIDGAVATWMAVSRAAMANVGSAYDSDVWSADSAFF